VHNGGLADTDLLGTVYTETRPKSSRDARGEFYSPASLCQMMAEMTIPAITPGQSIAEPAAGTGGMLRAAAQVIRQRGMNPADFWWVVNDVSHTAVACLAVNCHVWDLGPRVVIGIADTLAEPDWPERAWREQQEVIAQRDEQARLARSLAMFRRILTGDVFDDPGPAPAPQPTPPALAPAPAPVLAAKAAKPVRSIAAASVAARLADPERQAQAAEVLTLFEVV
jgi:N-6 DNA Methylase